jgi:hypothetical protein
MGATYYSLQLRTSERDPVVTALKDLAAHYKAENLRFYVAEPRDGWLAVFPSFIMDMENSVKALSTKIDCLIVLLLSADEDDLYCLFFRQGKQLPWLKIAAGRKRTGKERLKLAAKLEALAEVCDAEGRQRLLDILADATGVTFSSDLLRGVTEVLGVRNAFTSFEYLHRGEREGLAPPQEPLFISA